MKKKLLKKILLLCLSLGMLISISRTTVYASDVEVTSIDINNPDNDAIQGMTWQLFPTVYPSNATDKALTWTSSNTNVITVKSVSGNNTVGECTAVGVGKTTLTATAKNGVSASVEYEVIYDPDYSVYPKTIEFENTSITAKVGHNYKATVTLTGKGMDNSKIKWTSSDTDIFTIQSIQGAFGEGNWLKLNISTMIVPVGVGTATLTATTENGLQATCKVTTTLGGIFKFEAPLVSSKYISMAWKKQKGVTGYEVYRASQKGNKYTKIATTKNDKTIGSAQDRDVKAGTTYKYKVRAFIKSGNKKTYGEYSTVLIASTSTEKPNVTLTAKSKAIKVAWNKLSGATGYEVYYSTSKKGNYTLSQTLTKSGETSCTIKDLNGKASYYVKVRAYRKVNDVKIYSDYSSVKSIKTKK